MWRGVAEGAVARCPEGMRGRAAGFLIGFEGFGVCRRVGSGRAAYFLIQPTGFGVHRQAGPGRL